MADQNDQNNPDQTPDETPRPQQEAEGGDVQGVPIEQEPMAVEAPRRAASAEFEVRSEVGSQAALREAMDPANQSLTDALRLSFRVLQVVIVVLLVLFLVSGFETVSEGQTGVRLVFKRITTAGPDGAAFLEPGPQFNLPYPIGEFYIFDVERRVGLDRVFWPFMRPNETIQDAIDRSGSTTPLEPVRDGYVITREGDIAHLQLTGTFEVQDPVRYVDRINQQSRDSNADRIVQLALQRATIQAVASMSLAELVESAVDSNVVEYEVLQHAQDVLDELDCGVTVTQARVQETRPAFAIARIYDNLQAAREEANRDVQLASQRADGELTALAGEGYSRILDSIENYEEALQLDDDEQAAMHLEEINAAMEDAVVGGEVTNIIQTARDHQSQIESTLGNKARRFMGLLPAYRENPDLVIKERWLRVVSTVLSAPDAELWLAIQNGGDVVLRQYRLDRIKDARRQMELQRQETEQRMADPFSGINRAESMQRADEIDPTRPGRFFRREDLQPDDNGEGNE